MSAQAQADYLRTWARMAPEERAWVGVEASAVGYQASAGGVRLAKSADMVIVTMGVGGLAVGVILGYLACRAWLGRKSRRAAA